MSRCMSVGSENRELPFSSTVMTSSEHLEPGTIAAMARRSNGKELVSERSSH